MKKINFKKVFSGRNVVFSLLILVVIFLFGQSVLASSSWAGDIVGGLIAILINGIAKILVLLVGVLMSVAAYSDFINAAAVSKGWVVVRDVCNMFFVVILLVIAFATILGQEEYGAKKMLPKLIMAAVLINFSKLICGLMIDVASVVMLTFVNAFSAVGAGNILDVLGISEITKIDPNSNVTFSTVVGAYIFGLIYIIIATVVVASMLGMLVMRVVMIWILVVLSPLAFFLQAVPGKGQQYAQQWWTRWSSNLIVGPVLAFFLWLSFAALQSGGNASPIAVQEDPNASSYTAEIPDETAGAGVGSKAGTTAGMAKFVIAIGMLLGGMKIAQEVGGETGSALGKGMNALNKGKTLAIGAATGAAVGLSKGGAKLAGRGALGLASQTDKFLSKSKGDERKTWAGKMAKGWGDDLQTSAKKNRKATAAKYLGKLGMGEKTAIAGQAVIKTQSFQNVANMVKGSTIGGAVGGATTGPIGLIIGAIAGGIAGYNRSSKKGEAKENIKNYEIVENDYNKDKSEYNGHENFVNEYNDKNAKATALENKKKSGIPLSTDEEAELKKNTNFVLDNDNIARHSKGTKYLNNPSNQQKIQDKKAILDNLDKDKYDKDKKFVKNSNYLDSFSSTAAAMSDLTKSKDTAKKNVYNQSIDPEYWEGKNVSRCPSTGLRKEDKEELDILNGGGTEADLATNNIVNSIKKMSGRVAQEWAKAIAVMEESGPLGANLGKIKSGLQGKTTNKTNPNGINYEFNSDLWKGKTTKNYKKDLSSIDHFEAGSGNLQTQAFANNSAKAPADRTAAKDIMGVSYGKFNKKAAELGVGKLDEAAGVNQKMDGNKIKEVSDVMKAIIDDEIKALQGVRSEANTKKISQLNAAKTGLGDGKLSGLSLKNTDAVYKGETDSERRIAEYNTTQHETMHNAGATSETAVSESADSLQQAKLIGNVPASDSESGGKRYDEVLGKMIANMEKAGASQEAISQAISNQVEKWQTPNAQRVVETENGQRETMTDQLVDPGEKPTENFEKVTESMDKLSESFNKPRKTETSAKNKDLNFSTLTKDFLRAQNKGIIKPLEAMVVAEENKKTV